MGLLYASSHTDLSYLTWGYPAAGVFFLFNAMGKLFQLFNPRDWYETEIEMKKEEKI
jgi:hypothetical protein